MRHSKTGLIILFVLGSIFMLSGCTRDEHLQQRSITVTFKHGKIPGDPELFRQLIEQFERQNPDLAINDEILPDSTDEQHQFYVINLEGESSSFDVFAMDVIWVPEFARAGWLKDLSHLLPHAERGEFFKGPIEAVTYHDRIYAVPWYIDAGILYYRKDLLQKYGFAPPKTWDELIHAASVITRQEPGLYGFVWQGKQYEGLVCNTLEYLWSNGGDIIKGDRVVIDSPANRQALTLMRDLIYKYKITPAFVTTAVEEPTRHIFGKGQAVFMRNWPYAWNIFTREDAPVKGKVGIAKLPCFTGHTPASTLGGWQLGINKYSGNPEAAERFVRFLSSFDAQKSLALTVGFKPVRKRLYEDKDLLKAQPFITILYDVFEHARPRPVTPYYMMITHHLQSAFSAVLAGIKQPEAALKEVEAKIVFILRDGN